MVRRGMRWMLVVGVVGLTLAVAGITFASVAGAVSVNHGAAIADDGVLHGQS